MSILGVIPSRFNSSRFPGKPLVDIAGKSMIQRVYEQARKSAVLNDLIVATDDRRIFDHVIAFGGKVILTSPEHNNGTERCAETIELLKQSYDFVINIQGDEPFIKHEQIDLLGQGFKGETKLATLVKFETERELYDSPHEIKVTVSNQGKALYFSRSPIPHFKNTFDFKGFYKHIGIYAYRTDVLKKVVGLPPSKLELAESLEQLRWLENGYEIEIVETHEDSLSIDTPEDLERVKRLQQQIES